MNQCLELTRLLPVTHILNSVTGDATAEGIGDDGHFEPRQGNSLTLTEKPWSNH